MCNDGRCLQAANAALSGDFQRHAHSALLQIKGRLQAALGTAASSKLPGASGHPAAAADSGDAAAMLRRLQLHLVDSASLVKTGFATLIRSLKGHPNKEIAELARALIKSWKTQLKGESNSGTKGGNDAENAKTVPQSPAVNLPPGIVTTGTKACGLWHLGMLMCAATSDHGMLEMLILRPILLLIMRSCIADGLNDASCQQATRSVTRAASCFFRQLGTARLARIAMKIVW